MVQGSGNGLVLSVRYQAITWTICWPVSNVDEVRWCNMALPWTNNWLNRFVLHSKDKSAILHNMPEEVQDMLASPVNNELFKVLFFHIYMTKNVIFRSILEELQDMLSCRLDVSCLAAANVNTHDYCQIIANSYNFPSLESQNIIHHNLWRNLLKWISACFVSVCTQW